jgi:hypothetical protein
MGPQLHQVQSDSQPEEPELHNFAKSFLFRVDKMMIYLDFLLLFTAVLVTMCPGP